MTERDFKIEMLRFLMKNKNPMLYLELKTSCNIKVSDELYERYFKSMKDDVMVMWGGPPHEYTISDYGKAQYQVLLDNVESDKKAVELIEIQKRNLIANTEDILKNPFRYRFTWGLSASSILISTIISIYFANEKANELESLKKSQEQYKIELKECVRKVDELRLSRHAKVENDILFLKGQVNDSLKK